MTKVRAKHSRKRASATSEEQSDDLKSKSVHPDSAAMADQEDANEDDSGRLAECWQHDNRNLEFTQR